MCLLLGREDIEALSDLRDAEGLPVVLDELSEEDIETMVRLLRSGISRNRNKAIKIGTACSGRGSYGYCSQHHSHCGNWEHPFTRNWNGDRRSPWWDLGFEAEGSTTVKSWRP